MQSRFTLSAGESIKKILQIVGEMRGDVPFEMFLHEILDKMGTAMVPESGEELIILVLSALTKHPSCRLTIEELTQIVLGSFPTTNAYEKASNHASALTMEEKIKLVDHISKTFEINSSLQKSFAKQSASLLVKKF